MGRIVNISSAHGLVASANKVAYVTAKHGLEDLSKVTAIEGAAHGVTSNCVNPGYVRTPLVTKQIAAQAAIHGIPEEQVPARVLLNRSAVKRLIEPDEVAALVLWLCGAARGVGDRRRAAHGRRLDCELTNRIPDTYDRGAAMPQ